MMQTDVSAMLAILARIRVGGDVTIDEVKALKWSAGPELQSLVQTIYRKLIIFADDSDVRSRDRSYDWAWRTALNEYYAELSGHPSAIGR